MIRKVARGDKLRIPADAWNAIADAVNARQAINAGADGRNLNADVVLVRNDSGGDCERYDILGLDDVAISPTDNLAAFCEQIAFSGVTPVHATHANRIAVLQEPVASGAVGKAVVSRPTAVLINVTVEHDWTAGVDDADASRLTSGGQIPILWKESGTGEKWAIVDLGRAVAPTMPVILEQVNGSYGDDETITTWTYAVKTLGGQTLYAEVDILDDPYADPPTYQPPHQWRRPKIGAVAPATFGLVYLSGPNTGAISPWPRWGLLWCNEVPVVEAC